MKASSTLLVDKYGKAQRTPGLYRASSHPRAVLIVDTEGLATIFELACTEAVEIARHLFEASGMDRNDWACAAAWCLQHTEIPEGATN